jgi:protein O-GlcNAc transferase
MADLAKQHSASHWLQLTFAQYQAGDIHSAIATALEARAHGGMSDVLAGNLGAFYQILGDWPSAEAAYRESLSHNPNYANTLYNLGNLLSLRHIHQEAKHCYLQAMALVPDYADAHLGLGNLLAQMGEPVASITSLERAISLQPANSVYQAALLFNLAYNPQTTAEQMRDQALKVTSLISLEANTDKAFKPSIDKILRIGFVSGDFKDHPVGYFMENLLLHGNRTQFEWHAFSNFEASDAVAERLKTQFTSWTNIALMGDDTAHELIATKRIDVLFDLSGHTALNRLPLFASCAAPVQISWLGWHDTTGLAAMDYLLTDAASQPTAITEKPLFLTTRLCMTPPIGVPAISPQPALTNGFITFGSMQILAKLSDSCLQLWIEILQKAPTAKLLIRCKQFRENADIENFTKRAAAMGLPMDRVSLLPPLGRDDYLASFADIDILLDSMPYPGGTTTAEALWMGVPTITMGGNTMISRQGVGILTAAQMQDWITISADDYVAKALYWTKNMESLSNVRASLRGKVTKTPLFDGAQFARDFESAMREAANS